MFSIASIASLTSDPFFPEAFVPGRWTISKECSIRFLWYWANAFFDQSAYAFRMHTFPFVAAKSSIGPRASGLSLDVNTSSAERARFSKSR